MRYQRNTALAGIAALALLAGGSLASAQENQNSQPQTGQPQANHEMQMNKQPAANKMSQDAQQQNNQQQKIGQSAQERKMGQTAQEQKSGPAATKSKQQAAQTNTENKAASARRAAQIKQHGHRAMARTTKTHAATTAQERSRMTRQNTAARERKGLEGLQGNAQGNTQGNAPGMNAQGNAQSMQGMNVQLSEQQRGQIRGAVINAPGAPRAENIQFNVVPGTVIPRGSIRVVPVPRTLVRIEPRWRGLLYFVWMDDVVIVNPRDMRIVAVVPA